MKTYENLTAEEKVAYLEAQLVGVKESLVKRFGGYLRAVDSSMKKSTSFDEAIFSEHLEFAATTLANAILKDLGSTNSDADVACCGIACDTYSELLTVIREHEEEYSNACRTSVGWKKVLERRFGKEEH